MINLDMIRRMYSIASRWQGRRRIPACNWR